MQVSQRSMQVDYDPSAPKRFVQQPLPPRWRRACHVSAPVEVPVPQPAPVEPDRFVLVCERGMQQLFGKREPLRVETRARKRAREAREAREGL